MAELIFIWQALPNSKKYAFELADHTEFQLEYIKWMEKSLQSITQKYNYVCDDNDELRNKINNDVPTESYGIEGIPTHAIKEYEGTPTKSKSTISLEEILKYGCTTNPQRQIAKFYYDPDIPDSYDSKQGTANWMYPGDKHGRQKVNDILNTIKNNMIKNQKV